MNFCFIHSYTFRFHSNFATRHYVIEILLFIRQQVQLKLKSVFYRRSVRGNKKCPNFFLPAYFGLKFGRITQRERTNFSYKITHALTLKTRAQNNFRQNSSRTGSRFVQTRPAEKLMSWKDSA